MNAVEWNKKEELVADQAMKHLKQYSPLLAALAINSRAELALILKVQEYCYDNMNFLKAFQKINVLFYKSKSSRTTLWYVTEKRVLIGNQESSSFKFHVCISCVVQIHRQTRLILEWVPLNFKG